MLLEHEGHREGEFHVGILRQVFMLHGTTVPEFDTQVSDALTQ